MSEMSGKLGPDKSWFELVHSTRPSVEKEVVDNPDLLSRIENLMGFFNKTPVRYEDFDIDPEQDPLEGLRRSDTYKEKEKNKKAYPNNEQYTYIPGAHDTQKWLQTVREVYYKERNGANRVMAIRQATNGWNPMETYDFLNWLKFYEGGTHLKYKTAQLWYENGSPGYFLHIKQDNKKEEPASVNGKDIDMARDTIADELPVTEKKRIIEKQRNKIIGRLDSAEKLLRTQEGQIFAGKEFESLLETIYQLKKKIQMVNKISTSMRLYEDMIIREANLMNRKGFTKAANLLLSISQANNPPPPGTGSNETNSIPTMPVPPTPPQQGSGSAGGLPSVGPGMPQNPPESAPNEESVTPKGIKDFLNNLDPGKKDLSDNDDVLEVIDAIDINDSENEVLVTEAQEVPAPPPAPKPAPTPAKSKKPTEEPLEIMDKSKSEGIKPPTQVNDFDRIIDSAFANVTVVDIVNKLKDISKIYKTREIPRQLSIVDMMLDSKGLSSYFPSLSEAINKALESNNYIATRLDDILAKLEGGMEGKDLDLKGENQTPSPEMDALKQKLQNQDEKEKTRKKMRQQQADEELAQSMQPKETPEIDIEEDLKQPPPEQPAPAPKPTPVR